MRTSFLVILPAAALVLAGCASSPGFVEENWADSNAASLPRNGGYVPPEYDPDSDTFGGESDAIPPAARERRQQRATPGFAGRQHASSDYYPGAAAQTAEFDPREPVEPQPRPLETMSAEEQVQQEVDAELERRSRAFGGPQLGDPQKIHLGHNPGLTRIEPRPDFRGGSGGHSALTIEPEPGTEGTYRVRTPGYTQAGWQRTPAGAPPLPAGVRPGDCVTVVHAISGYDGRVQPEWHPVLCKSDRSPALVRNLQRALLRAGYPPGKIDGKFGPRTRSALQGYQRARFLPDDGRLHLSVLEELGVFRSSIY